METLLGKISSRRKHPWHIIDPMLLDKHKKTRRRMVDIAREFGIPYRQVTNRKYWLLYRQPNQKR